MSSPLEHADRVRSYLERSADTGAPTLGCLLGLTRVEDPRQFILALAADAPVLGSCGPGIAEAAVLADFALGGALRHHLRSPVTMPTITLDMQWDPGCLPLVRLVRVPDEAITARERDRTLGVAGYLCDDSGRTVGRVQAVFGVASSGSEESRPLPWDGIAAPSSPAPGPVADTTEAATLIEAWRHSMNIRSWADWHASEAVSEARQGSGHTAEIAPLSSAFANRAGHVQGGMVSALCVHTAAAAANLVVADACHLSVTFLSPHPVSVGTAAHSEVQRVGRRTNVVLVRVQSANGAPTALATCIFR